MPIILIFLLGAVALGAAGAAAMAVPVEAQRAILVKFAGWVNRNITPAEHDLVNRVIANRVKKKGSFYKLTFGDIYDAVVSVMDADRWRSMYQAVPELRGFFGPGERPPNQFETIPREYADEMKRCFAMTAMQVSGYAVGRSKAARAALMTSILRALIR